MFVRNEGFVCVPWDFGLTRKISYDLPKDKTSTVDFLHLVAWIKCHTQNFIDMPQSMHGFIDNVYCILARIARQRLGDRFWKHLTHSWTEGVPIVDATRQPYMRPYFAEVRQAPLINHDDFLFTVFKLANDIPVAATYQSLVANGTLGVMMNNRINTERTFKVDTKAIVGTNPDFLRNEALVMTFMSTNVRRIVVDIPGDWWVRGDACQP
jgi:hypothetical protein